MSKRAQTGRPGTARRVMNPDESNRLFVYEYDRGSNYEQDTRLTAALSALLPEDTLVHPDQRLFQTVHLITEYAWCEMHYEMRRAAALLREGDYLLAAQLLERAAAMGDVPVRAVQVLLDFLPQESLLRMRETFPENTTGLDSPGARNLRRAAVALWQEVEATVAREGLDVRRLIVAQGRGAPPARADRAPDLALVRQALLRLDGAVAAWKHHHLRLVWSQLGGHPETAASAASAAEETREGLPKSLRGQSTAGVRAMADRSLFPRLWESVDDTYRAFVPDEQTPA
jgi:tryptophan 2,3-dioxygenase